ncbi:MAG: hypothetical protein P4N59_19085 [Negativicutes bacterium]|nr:hypothetical protein [Negativicutes bacterium]
MRIIQHSPNMATDGIDPGKITISHLNDWNPERHPIVFLKPLIEGLLSRLPCPKSPPDDG